jgi:very-short-patch-repair endonuclease
VRLLGGVYISSRAGDVLFQRARAAVVLVHPDGAVGTHVTAARLRGVPVPMGPLERVTVARPEDRRQRHGLRCHIAALAASEISVVRGVRISAPARMFVELASLLSLVDLVVVGDWLVRNGHLGCEELVEYCITSHDRYAEHARVAAAYVRPDVDSPMETRLRMLLVLAGLPEPEVNLEIRDEDGVVTMRLDLAYRRVRLAVEYDGRHHLEDVGQWERDPERRDDLEQTGWRVLVVTSKGIYREPEVTVQRVWRALRSRGHRPLRPPTDGWRPHVRTDRRARSVA